MTSLLRAAGVVAAFAATAVVAPAQDKADLSAARFGGTIVGPTVSPSDLKGKAVVVEFWGIN